MHFLLENAKRVVIKLGSRILTDGSGKIDGARIHQICEQVRLLLDADIQVVVVSSGAIGLGMGRLGYTRRPTELDALQACAAVGQSVLTETWQAGFTPQGLNVAQILLTREDLRARNRHVAVKNLFEKLLADRIVPIVNENDSVSTEEIRFGENDVLSALVASLTKADMLIILTTMPGLVDFEGTGAVVPVVEVVTPQIEAMGGGPASPLSVGGMRSKIEAAKTATGSGCGVFIGSGEDPGIISLLLEGKATGTFFVPKALSLVSKKRWLAFFQSPAGTVRVDAGAGEALLNGGGSLLAKGVTGHRGNFPEGALVAIEGPEGNTFARGVSQYASNELQSIAGKDSREIQALFPERKRLEVVHRDSMVMLA